MPITVPDRTAGSLGTTKSNANAVSNEPQQATADQYNNLADKLIEVINQSNALELSTGRILWEWNGVDTSQFGAPVIYGTAGGNVGTLAGTIGTNVGAIAPAPGGTRLVVGTTGSSVTGTFYTVFPILQTLPNSYEVEINSDFINQTVNANNGWGLFTQADLSAGGHGYVWHAGGRRARVDAGTVQVGNLASSITTGASGQLRLRVEGRAGPFTDYAHFQQIVSFRFATTRADRVERNAFDAQDGTWSMVSAGLPPASWIGLNGNRFGLCLLSLTTNPNWNINSIRIRALS